MNYNKKTVLDVDVKGKKVLLRCDFNVPMAKDGSCVITDDKRIVAALPTIRYLLENGAAVIACSHMGKPVPSFDKFVKKGLEKGKAPEKLTEEAWKTSLAQLSLKPVAERLSQLLGQDVIMAADVVGEDAQANGDATIRWGYLERSNVDMVSQMTEMLSAQRAFQSAAQVTKIYDSLMNRITNEIGKV